MGLESPVGHEQSVPTASMHPWSLVYSSTALEEGFKQHQCAVWTASELRNLYMNLAAAVINFTITICMLPQGTVVEMLAAVMPYMTVAVLHWYLAARWRRWPRYRAVGSMFAEMCYSIICTLSMPTWVLHGTVADTKTFVRQFILGSGILIGYWCRFLTPTFFSTARWLIPLQSFFQAWHLTAPTCRQILATPQGMQAAQKLSMLLDSLAGTALESCPALSCHNLLYLLQLLSGSLLLYGCYRMENTNRLAYLQGRARLVKCWPFMPGIVQAVLHLVAYLQVVSVVWVLLQCSSIGA